MSGKLHQKIISKRYQISIPVIVDLLIPMILGSIAILAHARFRSHINLPGHHGLEFMALLLIAHLTSKSKWSTLLFSLGVAVFVFVPFLGFKNPLVAMVYVIPGITFGIFANSFSAINNKFLLIVLIGGFSYGCIPLIRFTLGLITGFMHKSLLLGPGIPFLSFFSFGLIGSTLGLGMYKLVKRLNL